jgi:hypothetical protein
MSHCYRHFPAFGQVAFNLLPVPPDILHGNVTSSQLEVSSYLTESTTRFSHKEQLLKRLPSSRILRRGAIVRTDVSEEGIVSVFRVKK